MPSALEFITDAMEIIGALGQNETPSSADANRGLSVINAMLASWSVDRTYIYSITQNTFPLVNGQASYTIGSGGNFNIDRPVKLDNVFVRINSIDYPLREINNQDYDNIAYKANGSFPQYYYYDPIFPIGTIYIYGVPTTGDIYIDTWSTLTQFTDLTTSLTFPPGYDEAITYGLAKRLCPRFGLTLTPEAAQMQIESEAAIKDRNLTAPVMKTEIGYLVGNNAMYNGRSSGY